jgi:hypothetical protein
MRPVAWSSTSRRQSFLLSHFVPLASMAMI